MPTDPSEREKCKRLVDEICIDEGQRLVGWREVPTDADEADLGPTARAEAPHIEQLFIAAGGGLEGDAFERKLYLIRKRATHLLAERSGNAAGQDFLCLQPCPPRC